jgi:hypothetical protein
MALSSDLVSQFVKVTNNGKSDQKETVAYGTFKLTDGKAYVQLDGSTMTTPVTSSADAKDGDRVTVLIKNHNVIVTGNITHPSINENSEPIDKLNAKFDSVTAEVGDFKSLYAKDFEAINGKFETLEAKNGEFEQLHAEHAEFKTVITEKVETDFMEVNEELVAQSAKIENLEATDAEFRTLKSDYGEFKTLTAYNFVAANVKIDDLTANKADITWANIDFANVDVAKLGEFFAKSGIIQDIITENGTVTGELVGVTIKGDLIEGNTIVADKLVIKGDDGLYYKLNTEAVTQDSRSDAYVKSSEVIDAVEGTLMDGVTTTTGEAVYSYITEDNILAYYCLVDSVYYAVDIETGAIEVKQTEYNSLDGRIITAKTIAAEKIAVTDLVAFGATIGGFNIGEHSIYSGVKASVDSSNPGSYLDDEGQFALGDSSSYMKYYKLLDEAGNEIVDESGNPIYKLIISADSVIFGSSGSLASELEDLANTVKIGKYINPDTGDSKPSVELSEEDGNDKLLLTNENVVFVDGENEGTKITKDSIATHNITIDGEFRHGSLAWGFRANGNYGLMWKGVGN